MISTLKKRPIEESELFDPELWIHHEFIESGRLKLFGDVGFLYEIELAKRELSRFLSDLEAFRKRTAYFEEIDGKKSYHYYISDIRGKGQIGRSNQYLTHWWYPYKAKFHPQMIKALINWCGLKNGDTLLDPFCGSGTALVEAKTLGINSVGIDISPLCKLISKVKCDILDLSYEELKDYPRESILRFFDKRLNKVKHLSSSIEEFLASEEKEEYEFTSDKRIYDFYETAYLYALSDYTYIERDIRKGFNENLDEILNTVEKFDELKRNLGIQLGKHDIRLGDARKLPFEDGGIEGVVTSPPYSIAVDYIENDLHALKYLGIDPSSLREEMAGLRGKREDKVKNYYADMELAISEMHRVLKKGSHCVIVIGDNVVNGLRLRNNEKFIELGQKAGFSFLKTIRRPILGGYAKLRYEYVILFKKV